MGQLLPFYSKSQLLLKTLNCKEWYLGITYLTQRHSKTNLKKEILLQHTNGFSFYRTLDLPAAGS
jgi:hypothetical protein